MNKPKVGIIGCGTTMKIDYRRGDIDVNRPIYQCSTCGKVFNWNKDSSWFGSYNDLEKHPDKIQYFCSDKCQGAQEKRKK